jgi:hypothetical protein
LLYDVDDRRLEFAEMIVFKGINYIVGAYNAANQFEEASKKYVAPLEQDYLLVKGVVAEIHRQNEIKKKLKELEDLKKKSTSEDP